VDLDKEAQNSSTRIVVVHVYADVREEAAIFPEVIALNDLDRVPIPGRGVKEQTNRSGPASRTYYAEAKRYGAI
jgi:hypothetical protein